MAENSKVVVINDDERELQVAIEMALYQHKEVGRFDQSDLALLEPLAASAATAIKNARLYEQAQQEIAERKRIEVERKKLQDQLVQAQKMEALGHLTGGIAPRFQQFTHGINGFTELL